MRPFERQGPSRSGRENDAVLTRKKKFEDAAEGLRRAIEEVSGPEARKEGNPEERSASVREPNPRDNLPRQHPIFKKPAPRFKISSLGDSRMSSSPFAQQMILGMYRQWWKRELRMPYGFCGCGCEKRTEKAGWTSARRGTVSGEPVPFLPFHRDRWGYPVLTNPSRGCACGCKRLTPLARNTRRDKQGFIYEFAGMRAAYLNRNHRPPEYAQGLTLHAPLGIRTGPLPDWLCDTKLEREEKAGLPEEELRWLAGVVNARLSFVTDRKKINLKIESTDRGLVERFLETTARGRTYDYQPGRDGASTACYWTTRSALEAANVLLALYDSLNSEKKSRAVKFLAEYSFPTPKVESRNGVITEAAEKRSDSLTPGETVESQERRGTNPR